jgi:hypothetical protein
MGTDVGLDGVHSVSEVVLTSLAILKVNWDHHQRDHIANFVPFVAEALRALPEDEVSLPALQARIAEAFGLAIPHGPLKTILARAKREGLVKVSGGIYRRTDKCVALEPLAALRDDALREHSALVDKLILFSRERFELEWTDEQAEDALLSYVSQKAGSILAARLRGDPLPEQSRSDTETSAYIINTFFVHLHERDPEGFGFLETVVKGSMLAQALYYPDLGAIDHRMQGLDVFFDTRIILQALVGNSYERKARRALFELVYELGANPRVFENTLKEVEGVLGREAQRLRRGTTSADRSYGVLTQQLIDDGVESSDLELLLARLPKTLGTLKVTVTPRPDPDRALTVDEERLAKLLAADRSEASPTDPGVLHDVDVTTAIHRLRGGRKQYRLESCCAVFVTTNYPMITITRKHFNEEYEEARIAHCYGDSAFETLMWLKKPLRAPDLPRRRLLADCLSALRPSDELWAQYAREIERLRASGEVTAEDFILLKHSLEAKSTLSELTMNDVNAFSEGTVLEVLRLSKELVQGEAAQELESLRGQLQSVKATGAARRDRIVLRSARYSSRVCGTLLWLLIPVLGALAYLTVPQNGLSSHVDRLVAPVIFVAFLVVNLMTLVGFSFGITLRGWLQTLEVKLARGLTRIQFRVAGFTNEEDGSPTDQIADVA